MTELLSAIAGAALGAVLGARYAVMQRGWKDHRYHVRQVPITWKAFIGQTGRLVKWVLILAALLLVAVLGVRGK